MQMRKIKYLSFFYGKAEFLIIITFIVITHILAYTCDLKLFFLGGGGGTLHLLRVVLCKIKLLVLHIS